MTKKLQIWRLPPVLIIHLKRFQNVNSRWIKSHKIVDFPLTGLDPTRYIMMVIVLISGFGVDIIFFIEFVNEFAEKRGY